MVFTGTSGNLRFVYPVNLMFRNDSGPSSSHSTALYLASLAEVGQGRNLSKVEIAAISWGVNIMSGIINTVGTKAIGTMSTFNLWWTLGGTFVLVITLLLKAPGKASMHRPMGIVLTSNVQNSAEFVFTNYEKRVKSFGT